MELANTPMSILAKIKEEATLGSGRGEKSLSEFPPLGE
jgi:hypothetical protein